MKLNEFYKMILASVKIETDEDDFLTVEHNEENIFLTKRKGMKVALPSKARLDGMFVADESGKFQQQYLIFHPLSEDSTSNGIGLDILIEHTKSEMEIALSGLGVLLLTAYMNPKLQTDLPMNINEFISNAKDKNIVGMKANGKAVDPTMLETWTKLITSYMKSVDHSLLTLIVPRTRKNANKDSNTREARLASDLWVELNKYNGTEDKVMINGINLRPKEVKIFKDILDLFLIDPNEKGTVIEGTKDLNVPGFIATMLLYHKIMSNVNRASIALEQADPVIAEDMRVTLGVTTTAIESAYTTYKKEILDIPNEEEINLGVNVANGKSGVTTNVSNVHPAIANNIQQVPVQFTPDKPKNGVEAILQRVNQRNSNFLFQQAQQQNRWGTGTYGNGINMTQSAMLQPAQATGGMVSRLNPSYNNMATNQMLQQSQMSSMVGQNNSGWGMQSTSSFGGGYNQGAFGYNLNAGRRW